MIPGEAGPAFQLHHRGIWEEQIVAKKKKSSSVGRKSRSNSGPKAEKKVPAKKLAKKKKSTTKKTANNRPPARKGSPVAVAHSVYSNHEIGQVAGKLWQTLDGQGAQNLAALKKSTNAPDDLVVAAVGWLAREDKLDFSTRDGRSVRVSLQ
jgi:hypothetical protein